MASRERSGGILVPPLVLAICAVGGAEAWCGTTGGGSQSFAVKIEIKTPVGNSTQTYTTKCHDCGPAPWHPPTPGDCWSCHGAAGSEFRGYPYRCTDENGTFAKCSDTPCDGKDPPVPPPAPPTGLGAIQEPGSSTGASPTALSLTATVYARTSLMSGIAAAAGSPVFAAAGGPADLPTFSCSAT